jgi:hypothetical protein
MGSPVPAKCLAAEDPAPNEAHIFGRGENQFLFNKQVDLESD